MPGSETPGTNSSPAQRALAQFRAVPGDADGPATSHEIQDAVDVGQHGVDLVRYKDDWSTGVATSLVDEISDGALAGQVQGQKRLVAQEHARVAEQCLGDSKALLLPPREQPDRSIGIIRRSHSMHNIIKALALKT